MQRSFNAMAGHLSSSVAFVSLAFPTKTMAWVHINYILDVATPTLREFGVSSYQECFDSCVQDTDCHALDFADNHCWLKTQGVDPPPKVMPKNQDISIIFL
jgi:hypothetical protein